MDPPSTLCKRTVTQKLDYHKRGVQKMDPPSTLCKITVKQMLNYHRRGSKQMDPPLPFTHFFERLVPDTEEPLKSQESPLQEG